MIKIKDVLLENNVKLESYRRLCLKSLKTNARFLKNSIEKIINKKVSTLGVIGSMLYPKRFNEESDVDIIAYIEDDSKYDEFDIDKDNIKIQGKIHLNPCGALDVHLELDGGTYHPEFYKIL